MTGVRYQASTGYAGYVGRDAQGYDGGLGRRFSDHEPIVFL